MSGLVAMLIEVVTLLCSAGVMFAGMMRTTSDTDGDRRSALWIFICGTVVAALVACT